MHAPEGAERGAALGCLSPVLLIDALRAHMRCGQCNALNPSALLPRLPKAGQGAGAAPAGCQCAPPIAPALVSAAQWLMKSTRTCCPPGRRDAASLLLQLRCLSTNNINEFCALGTQRPATGPSPASTRRQCYRHSCQKTPGPPRPPARALHHHARRTSAGSADCAGPRSGQWCRSCR